MHSTFASSLLSSGSMVAAGGVAQGAGQGGKDVMLYL